MTTLCPDNGSGTFKDGRYDFFQACSGTVHTVTSDPNSLVNKDYVDTIVAAGGAPGDAEYLVLSADATLTNEKVLLIDTAGAEPNGLEGNVVGSNYELRIAPNVQLAATLDGDFHAAASGNLILGTNTVPVTVALAQSIIAGTQTFNDAFLTAATRAIVMGANTFESSQAANWTATNLSVFGSGNTFSEGTTGLLDLLVAGTNSAIVGVNRGGVFGTGHTLTNNTTLHVAGEGHTITSTDKSIFMGDSIVAGSSVAGYQKVIGIGTNLNLQTTGAASTLDTVIAIGSGITCTSQAGPVSNCLVLSSNPAVVASSFHSSGSTGLYGASNILQMYGDTVVIGCDPASNGVNFVDVAPRTAEAPTIGDHLTNKTYVDAQLAAIVVPVNDVWSNQTLVTVNTALTTSEHVVRVSGNDISLTLPDGAGVTEGKFWVIKVIGATSYARVSCVVGGKLIYGPGGSTVSEVILVAGESMLFINVNETTPNVQYITA